MTWKIPPPSSGGLILSYQCSNHCRHCLYASSPSWREWMTEDDALRILTGLKKHSRYLTGIHIAGGEPMLRPDLVVSIVEHTIQIGLPLDYVETNAFWCWDDQKTEHAFQRLKEAGLPAILISSSPFHLEFIPMERVNRAVRIGRHIFGTRGVLLFTDYFYNQLQNIDAKHPLPLEDYLDAVGRERASLAFATEYSLIPNGRAATQLVDLYERHPASHFFGDTCQRELSSPHHIHIDLYGNYIAGLCAGITLGDGRDLDTLLSGIDLEEKPILDKLVQGGVEALFNWAVEKYDYQEDVMGYIAKCHLCLDIRRHLIDIGVNPPELEPLGFYANLG
jgi:hypothetical protein